jgi:hypothetical protein
MNYPVIVPQEFIGNRFELHSKTVFSKLELLVNGQPAKPGNKKNEIKFLTAAGQEVVAQLRDNLGQFALRINNKNISLVKPFQWYYYILIIGLPMGLGLRGGAIGAGIAALIALYTGRIIGSDLSKLAKFGWIMGIWLAGIVLALVLFVLFFILMSVFFGYELPA